jgi:hypothetical protein
MQGNRSPLAAIRIAGVAILAVAGACTAGSQTTPNLAGACQMTKCVCADASAMFWQAAETVPIEWQPNGDASCPSGYALVRVKDEKK